MQNRLHENGGGQKAMKISFRAFSTTLWRPKRVVIPGFIRNPQAVLLLAACPTPKSDRLLGIRSGLLPQRARRRFHHTAAALAANRSGDNLCKRSVSER
jgi:hypothetical protein